MGRTSGRCCADLRLLDNTVMAEQRCGKGTSSTGEQQVFNCLLTSGRETGRIWAATLAE